MRVVVAGRMARWLMAALFGLAPVSSTAAAAPAAVAQVGAGGVEANGFSGAASISADGRSVVFASTASNLVAGDTDDGWDVFIRDLRCGLTRLVSVSSTGEKGNGPSVTGTPQVSDDSRYMSFASLASNLVPADTNNTWDLFVRDLRQGLTRRVNLSASGAQSTGQLGGHAMSSTGRFVAFISSASLVAEDTNGVADVFVRDLWRGTTRRVSVSTAGRQADRGSYAGPAISADGRYIAFGSYATNLVPGDTNAAADVFVRDTWRHTTRRVDLGRDAAQANDEISGGLALTPDGRYVVFGSYATNLVAGDTNGRPDIFIRDLRRGTTQRVNLRSTGEQSTGLPYNTPSISAAGHLVGFIAQAPDLVPGAGPYGDVYLRDLRRHTTERLSVNTAGEPGNRPADAGVRFISADGQFATLTTDAPNLVTGDTNNAADVFVRDLHRRHTERVSLGNPTH